MPKKLHPADRADLEKIAQAVAFNVHLRAGPADKINRRAKTLAAAIRIADKLGTTRGGRKPLIYAVTADKLTVHVPATMIPEVRQEAEQKAAASHKQGHTAIEALAGCGPPPRRPTQTAPASPTGRPERAKARPRRESAPRLSRTLPRRSCRPTGFQRRNASAVSRQARRDHQAGGGRQCGGIEGDRDLDLFVIAEGDGTVSRPGGGGAAGVRQHLIREKPIGVQAGGYRAASQSPAMVPKRIAMLTKRKS